MIDSGNGRRCGRGRVYSRRIVGQGIPITVRLETFRTCTKVGETSVTIETKGFGGFFEGIKPTNEFDWMSSKVEVWIRGNKIVDIDLYS